MTCTDHGCTCNGVPIQPEGSPQPSPAAIYYYSDNGKPVGPITLAEMQAKWATKTITPDTLVWKIGTPNWVPAKELTEIAAATPPPVPPPSPVVTPAKPTLPTPTPVTADAGCTGKVLLSDDFRQVDDSWGVDQGTDEVIVEDGKVKVKPNPLAHFKILYNGQLFDDADYCVTVQNPTHMVNSTDSNLLAGLVFWSSDGSNFYTLEVAPVSQAAIGRVVNGKWLNPVPWHKVTSVRNGPGEKNVLHISTSGNNITAYINGQKLASIKSQKPDGGGLVGLWAQSEKNSRDAWKFLDLKVTEPAK